jgi:hypothetical protein
MDVLSGFHGGGRASLEQVALSLGLPGKLGMSGDQVWEYYLRGKVEEIKNYCETDVLNTYLIYLRFQLMRGLLDGAQYENELGLLRHKLEASKEPHLTRFLDNWNAAPGTF